MCTLSVVPGADGTTLRVMMNRDERRLRMAAAPPAAFMCDGVRALWPIDQQAGGTWIAANDAGVVLALMNANPGDTPARRLRETPSRGLVIPALISARTLAEVEDRFAARMAERPEGAPFTLVAIALDGIVTLAPGSPPRRGGYLWSSSSLGDACVEAPRRALFDHLLATSADALTAQERLHQHAWPDRRHLSALMSRPDACTVSRTTIVLSPGRSCMRYSQIIDGWPAGVTAAELVLERPWARVAA